MFKSNVIGNLGADAQVKESNGSKFVTFRVAHTESYTDQGGQKHESTTWIDCIMSNAESKVIPFLKKGVKVYVSGNCSLRVFSSAKYRQMMAGAQINVQSVELLGGSTDEVPRQLIDANGVIHQVNKYYLTDMKSVTLYSQSGQEFDVDEEGWVAPRREQPQEGSQDDSAGQ